MTAVFWDRIAEEYAAKPVDDPSAFERKITIMKSLIGRDDVVLDVGCGTGSLALRLAGSAREVHGLDVSPEMMRIARGKAEKQAAQNVTFHTGMFDATFTAFAEGSLDGLCACSLLHLVEDRAEVLARMHRLLKPGGFFVASTVCLGEDWVPYAPFLTVMRWLGKAPMVKTLSKKTLVKEIAEAGFVEITEPDVGAKPNISFVVARKPAR